MKVLQINTTVNTGSTGRIVEGLGKVLIDSGHESIIAYGRRGNPSQSKTIKIGSIMDIYNHGIKTLILDRHGFGSHLATQNLIQNIVAIKPDLIALHNLHGYYLNIEVLFNYLKKNNIPVLWTLFDCWAFTGHCTYYDSVGCEKWKSECYNCPKKGKYPRSLVFDQSKRNYKDKKKLFLLPKLMHLVTHSAWLKNEVSKSFLSGLPVHHIFNGTDLSIFKPQNISTQKLILGVANTWDERKGLMDFVKLRSILPYEYKIALIGLSSKQINNLPDGILGVSRTENIQELAEWYGKAMFFVNPTYQDNFPTTNIEALACGTPVITYDTGGSPEAVNMQTGRVVPKGDVAGIVSAIKELENLNRNDLREHCRRSAENNFDQVKQYNKYINLFEVLLSQKSLTN